jgi:hypothetical protein
MSEKKRNTKSSNGKGDSPRNNSSKSFRDNYSKINWKKKIKQKNSLDS